ncbi:MAG: nitrite reductase [Cyclobacteriaceae bacterium]
MSELLNPESKADILELQNRIERFRKGEIQEDRFKAFRLTRGVYGQRQADVQMFRIKVPYGKIRPNQLRTIADLSEKFTNGNLHLTTRQNIQLHYVRLDDTPKIWEALESVGVTARESCGNTVRSITASPYAGIDPEEPFDVSHYAEAVFRYFLRNPVCQDMGRKIKMAFSASEKDAAFTYIHDFGFIPRIENNVRGFRVIVGGGLGAQPFVAQVAYNFLPADRIIPFIEAGLRVFDRYGEREKRQKARLKYLIDPKKGIGLDQFLLLVEQEKRALPYQTFQIGAKNEAPEIPVHYNVSAIKLSDEKTFDQWRRANTFKQKQSDYYAVTVRIPLGNISSGVARSLAGIAENFASDDIRITVNQGILFRFVPEENLRFIYSELHQLGLHQPGFDTLADITACPGTDTCNLGVTNSTHISLVLEDMIRDEFQHLIAESNIKIKISGCMNSCGQHMIANIGFHGSSIKSSGKTAPAMQVVLGGGVDPEGKGFIAEKVIKVPTKRISTVVRILLEAYESSAEESEYFNDFFQRKGKIYFYDLLKHLSDTSTFQNEDFQDWGKQADFLPEIGVGECAGVMLDLVGTILQDSEEHLSKAKKALDEKQWANAIFFAYNSLVIGAKGILLGEDIRCNTHKGIISDFQKEISNKGLLRLDIPFDQLVLQINKRAPEKDFAHSYVNQARGFLKKIIEFRKSRQLILDNDQVVVSNHYKA